MTKFSVPWFLAALLAFAGPAYSAPLLHAMFQDHAVLQRGKPIAVYGRATPDSTITVSLNGKTAKARTDTSGHWHVQLPAMTAGGPYTLDAASNTGEKETIRDVMIGDVWLCSGQSNMQLSVRATKDADFQIAHSNDKDIRLLSVAMTPSDKPLETFSTPVSWQPESPANVGDFSAVCLYFAHALRRYENVPMGLIMSNWGGSRAQNWVSEPALRRTGGFSGDLDILDAYRTDPIHAQALWSARMERWWRAHLPVSAAPWETDYDASNWPIAPHDLSPWSLWNGGHSPDGHVGHMWFRTIVHLDAAEAGQPATLDLGKVHSEDQTWINGTAVGATAGAPRAEHPVPAGVLKTGDNIIVTNIYCGWRDCGLNGAPDDRAIKFRDGTSVPLTGPWRYKKVPANIAAPSLPWGPTRGMTMDYNGMIAPIGPYGLRGVLWYQGESDTTYADTYQKTLTALMADWRTRFKSDLPFLIVQLPNYGPIPVKPVESGWADVREAQRRTVASDRNAALAVTIDIGRPTILHPIEKEEVGRRLAIAARHLVYGETLAPSGPEIANAVRNGKHIIIHFRNVTGALAAFSGVPTAFELCGASAESCRFVAAHIQQDTVVLPDLAKATRVRYCWGDSPICTLTDAARLPAGPFEVPVAASAAH